MKNLLNNINWNQDLGIHLDMLNNITPAGRNEFYWEILKEVRGCNCLEIGFGTGFLSIMALQHGAIHVEAWEKDYYRYQLGCYVIQQLQLQDRITLHHGEYTKLLEHDSNLVVIHEIIGSNIWCEGMQQALPVGRHTILPGSYCMQFDVLAVPNDKFEAYPKRNFEPNVPVLESFKNLIQDLIDQSSKIICQRDYYKQPVLDQLKFYQIDVNNVSCLPDSITQTYSLEKYPKDHVLIFYPFASVLHKEKILPWSWSDPIVITNWNNSVCITQDLRSGNFYINEVT
jgi:hypothetical protein